MPETVTRPPGVTFAVVLAWVVAILDLASGAALVWLSLNAARIQVDLPADDLRTYGLVILGSGLLTAAIALGIAAGSQVSRIAMLLLMIARVVAAVYAYLTLGELVRWHALGQGGAALLVAVMLLTRPAHAFYRFRA